MLDDETTLQEEFLCRGVGKGRISGIADADEGAQERTPLVRGQKCSLQLTCLAIDWVIEINPSVRGRKGGGPISKPKLWLKSCLPK